MTSPSLTILKASHPKVGTGNNLTARVEAEMGSMELIGDKLGVNLKAVASTRATDTIKLVRGREASKSLGNNSLK